MAALHPTRMQDIAASQLVRGSCEYVRMSNCRCITYSYKIMIGTWPRYSLYGRCGVWDMILGTEVEKNPTRMYSRTAQDEKQQRGNRDSLCDNYRVPAKSSQTARWDDDLKNIYTQFAPTQATRCPIIRNRFLSSHLIAIVKLNALLQNDLVKAAAVTQSLRQRASASGA